MKDNIVQFRRPFGGVGDPLRELVTVSTFEMIAGIFELEDGYYLADDMGPFLDHERNTSCFPTFESAAQAIATLTELGFVGMRVVKWVDEKATDVVIMARL